MGMFVKDPHCTCPTCGSTVSVIWDRDARYWTGKCGTCGDILFPSNSKVRGK